MNNELEKIFHGVILEEEEELSLMHLCRMCSRTEEEIIELVNEGIIEPSGESIHKWRFSFRTIERVKKARRLQYDFDLSLAGVGLALHLLDRIEELESVLSKYKE